VIKKNIAATTCKKPVIAMPYGPKIKKINAMIFITFDILSVDFIIQVYIELSEKIESIV